MSCAASSLRRVWKSAQLYVGFHRDPEGRARGKPHAWPPINAKASIHPNPNEQETFVVMKGAESNNDRDIQIKLRPDMIVLRRDFKDAWEGVKIDEYSVTVKVGGILIRVGHDGSVTREDEGTTTWLEADGGVLKQTEFVDASMSADGMELTRRTPDNLSAITAQGILSKQR